MDLRTTTSSSMPLNCSSPPHRNGDPLSFDFLTDSFVDPKPIVTTNAANVNVGVSVSDDRVDAVTVQAHHHEPSSFFLPSVAPSSLALNHQHHQQEKHLHQQHHQHQQHQQHQHPGTSTSPRPAHACLSPHTSVAGRPSHGDVQRFSSASPVSRTSVEAAAAAAAAVATGSSPLSVVSPHVLPHSSFDQQQHHQQHQSHVEPTAYYPHGLSTRVTKREGRLIADQYTNADAFQQHTDQHQHQHQQPQPQQQQQQQQQQQHSVISPLKSHSFQKSIDPNDLFSDPIALYASLYTPDAPRLTKAERRRLRCLLRARRNPRRRLRSNLRQDSFLRSVNSSANVTSVNTVKATGTPTATTATSSSCGRNLNSLHHHFNSSAANMLSNCCNNNNNNNSANNDNNNEINNKGGNLNSTCSITSTAISSPGSGAVVGMSLKDKKAARVIRNREVALRARQMAKLKMKNLESENCSLKSRATSLESENLTLRSYVHRLTGGRIPPLTLLQSDSLPTAQGQWQQSHDGVSVDGAAIQQ